LSFAIVEIFKCTLGELGGSLLAEGKKMVGILSYKASSKLVIWNSEMKM